MSDPACAPQSRNPWAALCFCRASGGAPLWGQLKRQLGQQLFGLRLYHMCRLFIPEVCFWFIGFVVRLTSQWLFLRGQSVVGEGTLQEAGVLGKPAVGHGRGGCLIPVPAQPSPPAGNVGGQRRVCETVLQPGRVCVWGCGSAWFLQGAGQRVIREEAAQRPVQRSAHHKAAQHLVACACDSVCRPPPWPPAQCAALELT